MRKLSHVKREIAAHYEKLNRQRDVPRIPQKWIEGYLEQLYFTKRSGQVAEAWDDLNGLLLFVRTTTYTHLSQMPWWEYSRALEWLGANPPCEHVFETNTDNARRLTDRWNDFYAYVQQTFQELVPEVIETAREQICSGKTLKLVKKIPYTGDEFWLSLPEIATQNPIQFSTSEFWILVVFAQLDASWDKVEEHLKSALSIREKRKRIQTLLDKLERTGYMTKVSSLLRNRVDEETIQEAERWFYKKRIPTQKDTTSEAV